VGPAAVRPAGARGGRPAWLPYVIGVVALLLVAGGGFAVWKLAFSEPGPEEVAEEVLELQFAAWLTGDVDAARLCELTTPEAREDMVLEQGVSDSCRDFVEAYEELYDWMGDTRDEEDEECVDARAKVRPRFSSTAKESGSKAEVTTKLTLDGFAEYASACGDADEDEGDSTVKVTLKKSDDGWRVDEVEYED
jgi:hypothetical protein